MWVVTKDIKGAQIITLIASLLTLKLRTIAKMREYPIRATADE